MKPSVTQDKAEAQIKGVLRKLEEMSLRDGAAAAGSSEASGAMNGSSSHMLGDPLKKIKCSFCQFEQNSGEGGRDALITHYKDKLLKTDPQHFALFEPNYMNEMVICSVCSRDFNKARDLMQHIGGKLGGKEAEPHRKYLVDIATLFADKDIGILTSMDFMRQVMEMLGDMSSSSGTFTDASDESDDEFYDCDNGEQGMKSKRAAAAKLSAGTKKGKKGKGKKKKQKKTKMMEKEKVKCVNCDFEVFGELHDNMEAMESHFLLMMIGLDQAHMEVFKDGEMDISALPSCPVCEQAFEEATELIEHIVSKVKPVGQKSKHRNLLHHISSQFAMEFTFGDGDYEEFKNSLLYELANLTLSDAEDPDYAMAREMKCMRYHLKRLATVGEDEYENELEERQANGGFTDYEIDELSCQFIKPYDDDAWDALCVLDDFDYY